MENYSIKKFLSSPKPKGVQTNAGKAYQKHITTMRRQAAHDMSHQTEAIHN